MVSGTALGFSDHAGWAVMAAVRGDATRGFELVFRRRMETCPSELPRQAYHAVAEQGARRSVIGEVTARALELSRAAIAEAQRESPDLVAAGVAMGRMAIPSDLDRVLASHALLHAAEGEMYRDVLCEAALAAGLRVVRFMNKEVRSEAAAALGWSLDGFEQFLAGMGLQAGRPWTKDEKDAASAAILALATVQ